MSNPLSSNSKQSMSAGKAVLVGHLIVTIPVLILMFGITFGGLGLFGRNNAWLFLGISFVAGWLWWSFVIPRWRRWAIKKGVPLDELQKLGAMTGLIWSKGSIFEKTEFKVSDDE